MLKRELMAAAENLSKRKPGIVYILACRIFVDYRFGLTGRRARFEK